MSLYTLHNQVPCWGLFGNMHSTWTGTRCSNGNTIKSKHSVMSWAEITALWHCHFSTESVWLLQKKKVKSQKKKMAMGMAKNWNCHLSKTQGLGKKKSKQQNKTKQTKNKKTKKKKKRNAVQLQGKESHYYCMVMSRAYNGYQLYSIINQ